MNNSTRLYARCSSPKQDNESQEKPLRKWALDNCPDAIYVADVGTGRNMRRKGIQSIMEGIRAGSVKRVVVWKINRLGRSVKQVCDFLELCVENNIELVSLTESIDIRTPMGRMFVQLLATIAELENEQRSEATLAGLDAKYPRDPKTGKRPGFGGSKKGFSLKVTSDKARAIFALKEQGLSYRKIAKAVGLSDKTVRTVVLNPRPGYVTRTQASKLERDL